MRRLVAFVGACVVVGAGAVVAARPIAAADAPSVSPTVNVSPAQVSDGDTVLVTGNDWPASTQVAVQVCGAAGRGGSANCDLPSSTIVGTGTNGSFGTQLIVHVPPVPCPCVVKVDAVGTNATRSVPVQLAGAPTAPVPVVAKTRGTAPLRVESAKLDGGSWTGWFGMSVSRTLVLRVHNVSGAPVNQPLILVSAGRPSSPDGTQAVPPVGPFAIDETRTIRVPVKLGALAIGDYGVRVRAGAQGSMTSATSSARVWPWGLFAIALVLVQMLLLAGRNATRRRLARREARAAQGVEVGGGSLLVVEVPVEPDGALRSTAQWGPEGDHTPLSWRPPVSWRPPTRVMEDART